MSLEEIAMAQPSIQQQILEDLDRMPPDLQRRAQELVHCLPTRWYWDWTRTLLATWSA